MDPSIFMNLLTAALAGGAVAYLLIRPLAKNLGRRIEQMIPEPSEPLLGESYTHLVEICNSLADRMDEIERRQEFLEKMKEPLRLPTSGHAPEEGQSRP